MSSHSLRLSLYIKQAFSNIKGHLLRSFLTLLGVLVGTAAVVALLTGSELATRSALDQFKKLGTDLLAVNLSEPDSADNHQNAMDSLQQISFLTSNNIINTAPYTLHYSTIFQNGNKFDVSTLGVTSALQNIMKLQLQSGRFISDLDKNAFYCVVGSDLANNLNIKPEALIGSQVRINTFYFTIVGVLKETDKNLFMFADTNQSIIVPINTSLLMYKNAKVSNVIFKVNSEKNIKATQLELEHKLSTLTPGTKFHFSSPETIIQNMEKQSRIFTLLLGFIGCVALLVGGIGVMNIMLVSVSERRREIGIRMTVGATQTDILFLFLTEAAVLTVSGGVMGILLGEIVGVITAKFSHWEYYFLVTPPLIGFIVSVTVGIFFGYYPAQKASQLDPIEILRGD